MSPDGEIRRLTEEQPLRADEVPLTEAEAEQAMTMNRAERRRLYRHQMKQQKRGNANGRR